jgi:hypothetical protein
MENTIYKLNLHDSIQIDNSLQITRVPGGWIYTYTSIWDYGSTNEKVNVTSVFVKYDNEFYFKNEDD